LVLENIFGRPPGKLTRDLDFGFALSDWKQFENLKATLISTGDSRPTGRSNVSYISIPPISQLVSISFHSVAFKMAQ
jgi:predicted nucleotidyltransferase